MNSTDPRKRTVFFISDRTGVTAEMLGHSILTQFEHISFDYVVLPFVDSVERAAEVCAQIEHAGLSDGVRPIVFSTLVNPTIREIISRTKCLFLDGLQVFVGPLEQELGLRSTKVVGGTRSAVSVEYHQRIEAINFTLSHDDGLGEKDLEPTEIILVGVSRCGKTPTCLYMAIQFGIRAANCPLIPEDLDDQRLPTMAQQYRQRLFGLTIAPVRLHQIRSVRRPNSSYAALENCIREVHDAERLMRREGIPFLDTTTRSIEEIATEIIYRHGLDRHRY